MRTIEQYQDQLNALWAAFPMASQRAFMEYWLAIEFCHRKIECLKERKEDE